MQNNFNQPVVYGIQGGKGSFNEQAITTYFRNKNITNAKIEYLFTTENVLKAVTKSRTGQINNYKDNYGVNSVINKNDIGENPVINLDKSLSDVANNIENSNNLGKVKAVDFGIFAVANTLGGLVDETLNAIGKYKFTYVDKITINISHFLMKRKDAKFEDIKIVMAHPQVFKQCENTLKEKFTSLKFVSGEGDLIDHAAVAKALSEGSLDKNIAVMGPKILAEIYDFDIIAENLEDNKDNRTSFIIVKG